MAEEKELKEPEQWHLAVSDVVERDALSPEVRVELQALEMLRRHSTDQGLASPLIESAYMRLQEFARLIRLYRNVTTQLVPHSPREHLKVIETRKSRDPEAVAAAM